MSFDEAELFDDLDWIDKLEEASSSTDSEYCDIATKPRYEKRVKYVDNLRIISWWEFYANEVNLSEWEDEVQFYDEETDEFRKWTKKHDLSLEGISLLRSLRLDDITKLMQIDCSQFSALKSCKGYNKELGSALSALSLTASYNDGDTPSVELDDTFCEGNLIVDEKEFNLRPRLTRNLPSRRSTRIPPPNIRTDGISTIGPGATKKRQGYKQNRRLSWETFSTYNSNQKPSHSGPKSKTNSESKPEDKPMGTSSISMPILQNFKFPTEKKDKLSGKKSLFSSVSPI